MLNGYPDVNHKTRKKVLKVVEELGYRPNAVARSLVLSKTKTIGLVVSELTKSRSGHHFMFEVLCGVNDRLQEMGYDLVLFSTSPTAQGKTSYMDFVRQRRVDGVIMMGIRMDDPYTQEVAEASIPSVLIDVPLVSKTCSYVTTDNVAGARLAVEHLIALGHREIGFVNGHAQAAVSRDRLNGYRHALEAAGLEYNPDLVYHGNFEQADGFEGLRKLKQQQPDLTAVFFASDLMAIGGIRYMQSIGRRVPEDLSVVGFDDIDLASFIHPSLTTVRQMRYEMGKAAVETVLQMLEEEATGKGVILPPELIIRETTTLIAT